MFEQLDQKVPKRNLWWKLLTAGAILALAVMLLAYGAHAKPQPLPKVVAKVSIVAPSIPPASPPPEAPKSPKAPKPPDKKFIPPPDDGKLHAPKEVPKEVKIDPPTSESEGTDKDQKQSQQQGAPTCGLPGLPQCPPLIALGPVPIPLPPPPAPPPPAPKPVPQKPVVVGGRVQEANLVRKVVPQYPPLAKAARLQGIVRFTAIIGKDGTIQRLTYISGPSLLIVAAMDAVKQWSYKPTLLNEQPVEVSTTIDVNFTLSQ